MLKRIDWRSIGRNWFGKTSPRRRRTKSNKAGSAVCRIAPEVLESRALLTLTVNLGATTIAEDAGAAATTATVTRTGDTTNPLTVMLSSNDTSEATVQSSVVIAAGQTVSPAFDINAVDDLLVDGPQNVVITASETSLGNGIGILSVTDDDVATLNLSITATAVGEADGAAATTATVSRNTPVSYTHLTLPTTPYV